MSSILLSRTTATLLQKSCGQHALHTGRIPMLVLAASPAVPHQRCFSSSNEEPQASPSQQSEVFSVYTHYVSKIVLQHLQDARAGWLVEQGLDRGLQINSNGTFVLHFPSNCSSGSADGGKIWYVGPYLHTASVGWTRGVFLLDRSGRICENTIDFWNFEKIGGFLFVGEFTLVASVTTILKYLSTCS